MSPLGAGFKGICDTSNLGAGHLVLWEEQCVCSDLLSTLSSFLLLTFICLFEVTYQELIVLEKARVKVAGTDRRLLSECVLWGEGLALGLAFGWTPDLILTGQRCDFSIKQSLSPCQGTLIINRSSSIQTSSY